MLCEKEKGSFHQPRLCYFSQSKCCFSSKDDRYKWTSSKVKSSIELQTATMTKQTCSHLKDTCKLDSWTHIIFQSEFERRFTSHFLVAEWSGWFYRPGHSTGDWYIFYFAIRSCTQFRVIGVWKKSQVILQQFLQKNIS